MHAKPLWLTHDEGARPGNTCDQISAAYSDIIEAFAVLRNKAYLLDAFASMLYAVTVYPAAQDADLYRRITGCDIPALGRIYIGIRYTTHLDR